MKYIHTDEIKKVIERIWQLPNRDDKICCRGTIKMGLLDCGGVGKVQVIDMLKKLIK